MKAANFIKQLFIFIIILNLFSNSIAFAQKGKGTAVAANKSAAAAKCSGAWTGTVSYTRAQAMDNHKTVQRVSGRGQDITDFEMNYEYKAQVAVIESPEKNGSSAGIATIAHRMKSTEKVSAHEQNSCDRGKTWKDMSADSISVTQTVAQGKKDANVNVGVNSDGTYAVSVGVPQIYGQTTGSQSTVFSGQCTQKEGKTFNMPATQVTVDGNSLTSDGSHRVNPDNPNSLSGSYTHTWQNVTETITWNLRKCGAPLRLTDLKFEHPKFPDFANWQEIEELRGTIDGNMVRIKAKVLNASGETKSAKVKFIETFKGEKYNGSRPDEVLKDGEESITLDPGEEREVEMVWDTDGYAWFDDGRPRMYGRIGADLEENGKKVDSMSKPLKVAPKPLMLVHGVWEDYRIWEPLYQNLLTTTYSYDWKAFPVGQNASKGYMAMGDSLGYTNNIYDNADQLARYVKYAQEETNAWHVDMVAHSMGGLVARVYAQKQPSVPDGRPQVKHLMMLGTPNNGAACVDAFLGKFNLFEKDLKAAKELTSEPMQRFNQSVKNTGGTKFSALAGNPVPIICGGYEWNDGFVTVNSATYGVPDHSQANNLSFDLVDTRNFSNFVLPHVLTGPKGTYPRPVKSDPTDFDRWKIDDHYSVLGPDQDNSRNGSFYSVLWERESAANRFAEENPQTFSAERKLTPKQTLELEVPVEAAGNFGITFSALSPVAVSLVDDKGVVVSKNLTDSPLARSIFRMVYVRKPVTKGTWKIRIQNTSDAEQFFAGFGWSVKRLPANTPVAE